MPLVRDKTDRGEQDMTKIEEFENRVIQTGITVEDLKEYEKLLRWVRSNGGRRQHCWNTAASFPPDRAKEAVSLIRWGLERYPDSWYSTYMSCYMIGQIYERSGKWQAAHNAYLIADDALGEEQTAYRETLSGDLLWTLLHINGFQYSDKLRAYYDSFQRIDDFHAAFVNCAFRLAVAELVIALHDGDNETAKKAYDEAMTMAKPGFVSLIQGVWDRHRTTDKLKANTQECAQFLKSVRI